MHPLANAGLSASAVTVATFVLAHWHIDLPADVATAAVALVAAAVHATGELIAHFYPAAAPVVAAVVPEAPAAVSPVHPCHSAAGHEWGNANVRTVVRGRS